MIKNKKEIEIIHKIQLDASYFNANFHLKPQSYQTLYCELVEKHLSLYDLNTDHTIKDGVAWVIISFTFDIKKPIQKTGAIFARTWKSGLKGPYFMRDFTFEDAEGNVYFQGTSFSVLLNLETRRVCRDKKLPYFSLENYDVHVAKGFPTWKSAYREDSLPEKTPMQLCHVRKVENSFIDMLGHVNNIRYGEFIYDAMDDNHIQAMGALARMEIYFGAELKRGDTFSISKVVLGPSLYVCGQNQATNETSFHAALTFQSDYKL